MCNRYACGTDECTHREPRRNLLPSPMSPGDGGMSLSLLVPLMGKSSRQSGIVTNLGGHDLGHTKNETDTSR